MPIQTFALSSGKVPAAKPMHTGTLGKQDGQASTEAISKIPRPAAAGGWFPCRTGCFSSEYGLRQPEPMVGQDAVKKAFTDGQGRRTVRSGPGPTRYRRAWCASSKPLGPPASASTLLRV